MPLRENAPQTKAELWRYVAEKIEDEGLHYFLVDYTSPDYCNCDELDPELAKLWREFEELSKKICKHVGAS